MVDCGRDEPASEDRRSPRQAAAGHGQAVDGALEDLDRVGISPPSFVHARPGRASSEVIDQIRAEIMAGRLEPGDRLPNERELARQLGLSRVTVRDAMRSLEGAGLVEVRVGAHGGPFVKHPDLRVVTESLGTHLQFRGTSFLDLAEVRLALEVTAARLACQRATADDLAEMQATAECPPMGRLASGTAERSVDFHVALVRSAHNEALLAMFLAARVLIQEAFDVLHDREPDMAEVARDVHRELASIIGRRDEEAAMSLMREHLDDFMRRAERAAAAVRRIREPVAPLLRSRLARNEL